MKKIAFLTVILVFIVFYAPRAEKVKKVNVEKRLEGGVEVINNYVCPYKIEGELTNFSLKKEFDIDTESDELAEIGFNDIGTYFGIDSKENIYLVNMKSAENLIYKFDRNGNFSTSFGRKGRGPSELQSRAFPPLHLIITSKDEVAVTDPINHKLVFFESDGSLLKEIKLDSNIFAALPLKNGNYLVWKNILDPRGVYLQQNPLILCTSDFEEIKELDRQKIPNPMVGKMLKGTYHVISWSISRGKIFTGFQERGYEIYVYDLEGNLLRRIKKDYKHIPVPEEYKKEYLKPFERPRFDDIRKKIYFPKSMPPFHSFFNDDKGRLFVMTYENGENRKEYRYDIFNASGIFIGRKSLRIYHDTVGLRAKIKKDRLYCINEKESGYKVFTVYKIEWN